MIVQAMKHRRNGIPWHGCDMGSPEDRINIGKNRMERGWKAEETIDKVNKDAEQEAKQIINNDIKIQFDRDGNVKQGEGGAPTASVIDGAIQSLMIMQTEVQRQNAILKSIDPTAYAAAAPVGPVV